MPAVELSAIEEARRMLKPGAPAFVVESVAAQLSSMREARRLIDLDGVVVKDGKDNPVPHPALRVEADAQRRIVELCRRYLR